MRQSGTNALMYVPIYCGIDGQGNPWPFYITKESPATRNLLLYIPFKSILDLKYPASRP